MTKKNEFSDLVEKVDQQFKEIEKKNERLIAKSKQADSKKVKTEENRTEQKQKEQKDLQKFRIKEKLVYAVIVFVMGHVLLTPLYLKFPEYAANMFIYASVSLGVICIAVIDYG